MLIAVKSFSVIERIVFVLLIVGMLGSVIWMLSMLNQRSSVFVPAQGGTITEGIIGTPRFINPILAESTVDDDLTRLVYSGLMRSLDGQPIPDLAESYTASADGTEYTFILRNDAMFHDKTPVTADDVLFTITSIQNSAIKSPDRASWTGVLAEKIDTRTVKFTLTQPYAGFLDNMTVGIVPRHLWSSLPSDQFATTDLNIQAVGSGPYKIKKIKRNSTGAPEKITLVSFNKFALGEPLINRIIVQFYANENSLRQAVTKGPVDAVSAFDPEIVSELASKKRVTVHTTPLPRVFGLYINQNEAPLFLDKNITKAFNIAINKSAIVRRVLYNYGTPLEGPIPPNVLGYTEPSESLRTMTSEARKETANRMLDQAGWRLNQSGVREKDGTPLAFSIATSNTPELKEVATMIKEQLSEIGVTVTVQVFETGNLEQDIIRPRQYQTLLFGQVIKHDTDLFAFWHSSQRNDPGLNIALYTDTKTDAILNTAVETLDPAERAQLYREFTENLNNDNPAIFLYAPDLIYVADKRIQGVSLEHVKTTSDRWNNVYTWYVHTNNLWKPFINQ